MHTGPHTSDNNGSRRRHPVVRLNEHYTGELTVIARVYPHPAAASARADRVEPGGIVSIAHTPDGPTTTRIAFLQPATTLRPGDLARAANASLHSHRVETRAR